MSSVLKTFGLPEQPAEINWKVTRARLAYWGSVLGMVLVLMLVFLPMVVRGLRIGFPSLGIRSPLLGIDGAIVLAWVLLFAVPVYWRMILQMWLGSDDVFHSLGRHTENHKILVWILGVVVLLADGYAFFSAAGETEGTWGESMFSVGACVLTLGYMAIVLSMSYFSLVLKARLDALEEKEGKSCDEKS
jgi:hypothetical protein